SAAGQPAPTPGLSRRLGVQVGEQLSYHPGYSRGTTLQLNPDAFHILLSGFSSCPRAIGSRTLHPSGRVSMNAMRLLSVIALAAIAAPAVRAQEIPKPGPEHEVLKKLEGNWDITMKAGGAEFKGTVTYKMDLGGLWLVSALECDLGGMKF